MDTHQKLLRFSAIMLALATAIHLLSDKLPRLQPEDVIAAMVFFHTGRIAEPKEEEPPPETTPPAQEPPPAEPSPTPLILTPADARALEVSNVAGCAIDKTQLLQKPLSWSLPTQNPTVLILHTHGTESYTNTENYPESSQYRTAEEAYNMISIGAELATHLEAAGIRVIHHRQAFDQVSYNGAYSAAREVIREYLADYPDLCLVLDLHRDAMTDSQGRQLAYTLQTDQGEAAQLMLVCGSDAGGLDYPRWQENLSLGVKLQTALEGVCPGICRPVSLRTGRYNQDLFDNMVLIEVGAAGNTRQQALLSARYLAQGIIAMQWGAVYRENG